MPRTIAITGSTAGIGLAIARAFVEGGERVILHYGRNRSRAESARASLEAIQAGSVAAVIEADLATLEGMGHLKATLFEFPDSIDGLVCNAGPFRIEHWTEPDDEQLRQTFHANLLAPWTLLQALIPRLRVSKAVVTCIGQNAIQELRPAPRWTAYNAAKAGLVVLVRTVAVEEGPHGVRINLVNPGIIDTGHYRPEFVARIAKEIPLGRVGSPEDVARTVHWLHSAAAGYISGSVIDVHGGCMQ